MPHKRRVHYKGTHPHTFEEKYKEHDPLRYADTIEKVIEKGSTPAGMHIPIAVNEILTALRIRPGESGLDCTLGYGGHTRRMLRCLLGLSGEIDFSDPEWAGKTAAAGVTTKELAAARGHLTALDVDSENMARTERMLRAEGFDERILTVRHLNFAKIGTAFDAKFDFILADLGVSSMQLDEPARGFSWKKDGPLDLRLDPASGATAAERLAELSFEEITGMLRENADEPCAEEIARAIIRAEKKGERIGTTAQLRAIVEDAVTKAVSGTQGLKKRDVEELVRKSLTRTFQALRIDVNHEYESLYGLLSALPEVLRPGGRVAILTFHSGEDRLVKKAFRQGARDGIYTDVPADAIRPSEAECRRNPRARSAKLRTAVRT